MLELTVRQVGKLLLQAQWTCRSHCRVRRPGGNVVENDYREAQTDLGRFSTICGMWSLLNNVPFPGRALGPDLRMQVAGGGTVSALSLFRDSLEPSWEHHTGEHDGIMEWRVNTDTRADMEAAWLHMVTEIIGGDDQSPNVHSVFVGMRLVDKTTVRCRCFNAKFELWTRGFLTPDSISEVYARIALCTTGSHSSPVFTLHHDKTHPKPIEEKSLKKASMKKRSKTKSRRTNSLGIN